METNKQKMKRLRKEFNLACRERDGEQCVCCIDNPLNWDRKKQIITPSEITVHHITDRHEMPNDGYAKENGICLCDAHHKLAEVFHTSKGKKCSNGMCPNNLYEKIGSSKKIAFKACEKLK